MGKLRLHFRIRQRQQSNPQDYFDQMIEKYGDVMRFDSAGTFYLPITEAAVREARESHFMIADTKPHPSLVVHEMIGEMEVATYEEAHDIATESGADHCYAEYVVPFFIDKEPE